MKIVQVSPITNFKFKENFSYFSQYDYQKFDLVKVKIRNSEVFAIVTEVKDAEEIKIDIKKSDYVIKKIDNTKVFYKLSIPFLKSAFKIANFYSIREGFVISQFTPSFIFEEEISLPNNYKNLSVSVTNLVNEKFCLQGQFNERIIFYKSFIRESFAKKESVMITVPHSFLTKIIADELSGGIENFVFVLNSEISKTKQKKIWERVLGFSSPCLLVCTSNFISLPRNDFKNFIIESENKNYKRPSPPFISGKLFLEFFTNDLNARLYYSDNMLSLNVQKEILEGKVTPTDVFGRKAKKTTSKILDTQTDDPDNRKGRTLIGNIASEIIEQSEKTLEKNLIFASRKGLSPITICGDCGEVLKCETCDSSLVFKKKDDLPIFYCAKCKKASATERLCSTCGSYKLFGYGAGIDKLEEEIKRRFKNVNVYKIDKDSVKSAREAFLVYEEFIKDTRGLLLATAMASPYIDHRIDNVVIASLDGVLSIPDFSIYEQLFKELLDLYEKARSVFVIQTKNPKNPFFELFLSGDIKRFTDSELETRKILGFPPYKTIIKIEIHSTCEAIEEEKDSLVRLLNMYNPEILSGSNSKTRRAIILRLDKSIWPNAKLSGILNSLPKDYLVEIDPERLI